MVCISVILTGLTLTLPPASPPLVAFPPLLDAKGSPPRSPSRSKPEDDELEVVVVEAAVGCCGTGWASFPADTGAGWGMVPAADEAAANGVFTAPGRGTVTPVEAGGATAGCAQGEKRPGSIINSSVTSISQYDQFTVTSNLQH